MQDAGKARVVLDHQDGAGARAHGHAVAVVPDAAARTTLGFGGHKRWCRRQRALAWRGADRLRHGRCRCSLPLQGQRRSRVLQRLGVGRCQRSGQGQREGAALVGHALHRQLAAQQVRQVARNRQPQPGAAVLAVRAAIGLAERVKNQVLLVQRNADAGVAHRKGHRVARVPGDVQRHLAVGCELDCVGQQVAQDLRQAQRVGVDAGRRLRVQHHGQRQAFLLGQRAQRLNERLHGALQVHRLHGHRGLPGLDLRQVQDVVDQRQQIVARRQDGGGVLDLLGRQVALFVVRQQFGQDQCRIQRRAQFMAHVGQKFALVLAGNFQVARFFGQGLLRHDQVGGLAFQFLRLFFQKGVAALQFALLNFHLRLRLLQHAALLLQLFVADAQFFLLRLQLFRLALRFFQQFLQARAVGGRADGAGHSFGRAFQQFDVGAVQRPEKPHLQHRVQFALQERRHHHQFGCHAAAGAGRNLQVAGRHAAHMHQRLVLRHLACQPLAGRNAGGRLTVGQRKAAKTLQRPVGLHGVGGAHARIHELRQVRQRLLPQVVQAHVALQALAQAHQAALDPALLHLGAVVARIHHCRHQDQHQQHGCTHPGDGAGKARRFFPLHAPVFPFSALRGQHFTHQGADVDHVDAAHIGHHHRQRSAAVATALQADGFRHFRHLLLRQHRQPRQALGLRRIPAQPAQGFKALLQPLLGGRIGLQVALVVGQQIAALASLRVPQRQQHQLRQVNGAHRGVHLLDRLGALFGGLVGHAGNHHGGQRGQQGPHQQAVGQHPAVTPARFCHGRRRIHMQFKKTGNTGQDRKRHHTDRAAQRAGTSAGSTPLCKNCQQRRHPKRWQGRCQGTQQRVWKRFFSSLLQQTGCSIRSCAQQAFSAKGCTAEG